MTNDDITKIKVGKFSVGVVGLKAAGAPCAGDGVLRLIANYGSRDVYSDGSRYQSQLRCCQDYRGSWHGVDGRFCSAWSAESWLSLQPFKSDVPLQ